MGPRPGASLPERSYSLPPWRLSRNLGRVLGQAWTLPRGDTPGPPWVPRLRLGPLLSAGRADVPRSFALKTLD